MPSAGHRDEAHVWQVAAFGGVELLRARYAAFSFAPHAHDEYMIIVTEGGAGRPYFWGRDQPVGAGDLFVLPPGEVHGGGAARGAIWAYRAFYAPAALMHRAAGERAGSGQHPPRFTQQIERDPGLAGLLRRAHAASEAPDSALAHESRLLAALVGLVARCAEHPTPPQLLGHEHRAVRLAREYLESLPGENVSLDTLAQAAGIGPYHLCRVFRRAIGLSPHAYQLQVRVRLAKDLLLHGRPIAEVAATTGFADQAHLTRHFKRLVGVTPGQYGRG